MDALTESKICIFVYIPKVWGQHMRKIELLRCCGILLGDTTCHISYVHTSLPFTNLLIDSGYLLDTLIYFQPKLFIL